MHLPHCLGSKMPIKKLSHPSVVITFCPDDTTPYESFNERPEKRGLGIFVGIASKNVTDDIGICWDELD